MIWLPICCWLIGNLFYWFNKHLVFQFIPVYYCWRTFIDLIVEGGIVIYLPNVLIYVTVSWFRVDYLTVVVVVVLIIVTVDYQTLLFLFLRTFIDYSRVLLWQAFPHCPQALFIDATWPGAIRFYGWLRAVLLLCCRWFPTCDLTYRIEYQARTVWRGRAPLLLLRTSYCWPDTVFIDLLTLVVVGSVIVILIILTMPVDHLRWRLLLIWPPMVLITSYLRFPWRIQAGPSHRRTVGVLPHYPLRVTAVVVVFTPLLTPTPYGRVDCNGTLIVDCDDPLCWHRTYPFVIIVVVIIGGVDSNWFIDITRSILTYYPLLWYCWYSILTIYKLLWTSHWTHYWIQASLTVEQAFPTIVTVLPGEWWWPGWLPDHCDWWRQWPPFCCDLTLWRCRCWIIIDHSGGVCIILNPRPILLS